jgi:hypothetical protein
VEEIGSKDTRLKKEDSGPLPLSLLEEDFRITDSARVEDIAEINITSRMFLKFTELGYNRKVRIYLFSGTPLFPRASSHIVWRVSMQRFFHAL